MTGVKLRNLNVFSIKYLAVHLLVIVLVDAFDRKPEEMRVVTLS